MSDDVRRHEQAAARHERDAERCLELGDAVRAALHREAARHELAGADLERRWAELAASGTEEELSEVAEPESDSGPGLIEVTARERAVSLRESAAEGRERVADEREREADEREAAANQREAAADAREGTAEEREIERRHRIRQQQERHRAAGRREQAALDRERAASERDPTYRATEDTGEERA